MARVLITGSADGLGLMAAQLLIEQGHAVVLHGRNAARSQDALKAAPGAAGVVTGDLSTVAAMQAVAEEANALGRFDAVIHNAALGYQEPRRIETDPGVPHVFAVNVLAPYVLTALMARPSRLVYLSSGLHHRVEARLDDLLWTRRRWDGMTAYSESKLCDVLLAFAVGRRWPEVLSNALEPGWVATKMGGPAATGDLSQGHLTQAWLAVSDDPQARVSGGYFYHKAALQPHPLTRDPKAQDALIAVCERVSGIVLPA